MYKLCGSEPDGNAWPKTISLFQISLEVTEGIKCEKKYQPKMKSMFSIPYYPTYLFKLRLSGDILPYTTQRILPIKMIDGRVRIFFVKNTEESVFFKMFFTIKS